MELELLLQQIEQIQQHKQHYQQQPSLSDALLSSANTIKDLQDENYRLKVGLGAGLGGGMAATTAASSWNVYLFCLNGKKIFKVKTEKFFYFLQSRT